MQKKKGGGGGDGLSFRVVLREDLKRRKSKHANTSGEVSTSKRKIWAKALKVERVCLRASKLEQLEHRE